ncbi:MAG: hypothetical protein HY520_01395, partial [Candidatus Aenigmarchaeota archaeon]|nr:hypothetical protein [Candidatus Aenigmarchaeota archaeon]
GAVIAVGSSQAARERANPFSFAERKEMLERALRAAGALDRCRIAGVPDVHNDVRWAASVQGLGFQVAVTGNPWVKRCLRAYPQQEPALFQPERYNATRIRNLIRAGRPWQDLVPPTVVDQVTSLLASGAVAITGEPEPLSTAAD